MPIWSASLTVSSLDWTPRREASILPAKASAIWPMTDFTSSAVSILPKLMKTSSPPSSEASVKDLAATSSGTPVSAVADGTVTYAGWKGGNGRLIVLRHGAGYESTYGHLSRFAKSLRSGRRVSQGDVIGYVGSTGLSSGPHLDFRLKLNGKPLNFLKIKYRSSSGVSGKARETVAAAIRALD